MGDNVLTVLASVIEVFGLVAVGWFYSSRWKPDLTGLVRVLVYLFLPALVFTSVLDAKLAAGDVRDLVAGTAIQIGFGILIGALSLRLLRIRDGRDLLLPISFVNSANLPFPLVLANFGQAGLSRAVVCYLVTSLLVYTVGAAMLRGSVRLKEVMKEPTVAAALLGLGLRFLPVEVPDLALRPLRLAASAAVPCMLVVFGDTLAQARLNGFKEALLITCLRYLSGAIALLTTLVVLEPSGDTRKILVLYALLPSAVVNVVLTRQAGRHDAAVAAGVLLTTAVALVLLPAILTFLH